MAGLRKRHARASVWLASGLLGLPGCGLVSGLDRLDSVDCVGPCDAGVSTSRLDATADGSDSDVAIVDGGADANAASDAQEEPSSCGPLDTPTNCGACGVECDTTTSTSQGCGNGTCMYVCEPKRADCNMASPNTDGCECPTTGCCGTACETIHSDGVGYDFYDCFEAGTINQAQAMAACEAQTGAAALCTTHDCGGDAGTAICTTLASPCVCWTYSGPESGHVYSSGAAAPLGCACATATAPTWD